MALAGDDIHFHYSGAGSYMGSQPDPNASLGNYIASASDRLYHTEGTITAVTNATHITSAAFSGQDFTDDWILFVTGSAFLSAAKIVAMDGGTNEAWFDRPVSGMSPGDAFRVHSKHNLFDQIASAEALPGEDEFRAIYVRNETGVVLTLIRVYLSLTQDGAPVAAVALKDGMASQIGSIANEDTEPDLATSLSDTNARFETMYDYSLAYPGTPSGLNNNNQSPIWLRRRVPAISGPQSDVVWAVVMEGTNTGGDPDPIRSAALIVFDGLGFTPQLSVQEDRYTYIGGGARVEALVEDEGGTPLEEFDIEWTLTGDGSLDVSTGQTDEDGKTVAAYTAPTDQGKVGQSATVTARIL